MKPLNMMGHQVVVRAVYRKKKTWDGERRRHVLSYLVVDLPKPRTGWYVGERNLRTGDVVPGGYEDPPEFRGGGNIKAHAVVFWPTLAPVLVPDGLLVPRCHTGPLADPAPYSPQGSPEARAQALAAYQTQQFRGENARDARGRFIGG